MTKSLKLIATIFMFASLFSSCSGDDGATTTQTRAPKPASTNNRPMEIPMPTEAELSVMRLTRLATQEIEQESLKITTDQASMIVPILDEWLNAIITDTDGDGQTFVDKIALELTLEQMQFIPEQTMNRGNGRPPEGEERSQDQRPPRGERPINIAIDDQLAMLITILSKI